MLCTRQALRLGEAAIFHRSDTTGTVSAMGEHLKWDVWAQTPRYSQIFGAANSAGVSRCMSNGTIGKDEWCAYKNDTNSEKFTQFGNMRNSQYENSTKGMMHDAHYDDDPSGCTVYALEMICALEISSTHVSTCRARHTHNSQPDTRSPKKPLT